MRQKLPLPIVFAIAGALLFLLAFLRLQLQEEKLNQALQPVARVESVNGPALLERKTVRESLRERSLIQKLDLIETAADAEVLLSFANGEEVRLLENSLALLDMESGRPLIILKSGDLWVEKAKDGSDSVMVSRQGVRRSLNEDFQARMSPHARPEEQEAIPTPEQVSGEVRPRDLRAAEGTPTRLESLTASYIQDTLRNQRNLFFKCYTQLLQRSPGVHGEAAVAFTIEKNGRVHQAEVSSSTLQDPQFKSCLTDAMKRVEFKSFAGDPVSALFPIRFE